MVTNADGVAVSWDTLQAWSDGECAAFGIPRVPEPTAPAAGQMEASRELVDADGSPVWSVTYQPIPAPEPERAMDGPTNSDWRVGLIMWGRFEEVEAKVIAARDSGSVEGAIAWQRWEYANNVYRADLMALKDTFGFTAADVEESLYRAAAVPAALAARATA
jgi:hypothetical protein